MRLISNMIGINRRSWIQFLQTQISGQYTVVLLLLCSLSSFASSVEPWVPEGFADFTTEEVASLAVFFEDKYLGV